jgi:hypothetical protein
MQCKTRAKRLGIQSGEISMLLAACAAEQSSQRIFASSVVDQQINAASISCGRQRSKPIVTADTPQNTSQCCPLLAGLPWVVLLSTAQQSGVVVAILK